jgi:hypothetical protein
MAQGISYFRGPWPRSPGGVTVSLYAGEETETANDRNGLCQRLLERFAIRRSLGECTWQGTRGQGMNVSQTLCTTKSYGSPAGRLPPVQFGPSGDAGP